MLYGRKAPVPAKDPVLQLREKVYEVPPLCLRSTVHSRDVPSEPVEAPVPGCVSGRDRDTGSTAMSKSDTFQGPGGFRTPSASGKNCPQPHSREKIDITKMG